jgi:hypothetical protein
MRAAAAATTTTTTTRACELGMVLSILFLS